MQIKTCPARVKAAEVGEDQPAGVFEALVSVFGTVDADGDVVVPGAFTDTLAEWATADGPLPVIWSHMSHDPDMHIGHVLAARETDDGLWVRAQLDLDAAKAAQVYRLLKGRRVTNMSFAFDVLDAGPAVVDGRDVTELRRLKVYEVGPTLIGANPDTRLLDVKHADGVPAGTSAGPVKTDEPPQAVKVDEPSPRGCAAMVLPELYAVELDVLTA